MENAKDTQSSEEKQGDEKKNPAVRAEVAQGSEVPSEGAPHDTGAEETREQRSEEENLGEQQSDDEQQSAEPTLDEQLAQAKSEAVESYNSYLRAVADLDTYRRRVVREKEELKQYAISSLLEDFLPIYDNLGLGLMSAEQSSDPKVLVQGIQMVLTQFKSLLEEKGISEVAPEKGSEFDPNKHEAFQTKPSDEVEEGRVLQLMRKGFSMNGRLIRPASVVVSGGPTGSEG